MDIQINYRPIVTVGTNPQRRFLKKTTSSNSYPAIELVITNEEEEDIFLIAIDLEYNKLRVPFCNVQKTKPIMSEGDFKKIVTIEKLIGDYNTVHKSNITSLVGSVIIITDEYKEEFKSEIIDY